MKTNFLKFSNQEKLSRVQLMSIFGGDGDDYDHTGPKILRPVRPTGGGGGTPPPTSGGN